MINKRPLWLALAGAAILGANYLGSAVNLIQLPANLQVIQTTVKPVMDEIRPYAGALQTVVVAGVVLLVAYGLDTHTWVLRAYRRLMAQGALQFRAHASLADRANSVAHRIHGLAAKYPRIMPDN